MGERDRYQSGYDHDRARRDEAERYEQRRPRQWGSSAENDQRPDRERYANYYADRQYGTRGPDEREEGSRYGAEEEWRNRPRFEGARDYRDDNEYRRVEHYDGRSWGGGRSENEGRGSYSDWQRTSGSSYSPGPNQSRPFRGANPGYNSRFTQLEPYGQGWGDTNQRDTRSGYDRDDARQPQRGRDTESFGEQVREAGHRIARSVKRAFRGPKGYKRSDDRIREDVSDRLGDHEYLDCSDVEVTVSNGEVTLTGTVRTRQEKFLAEEVADDVSGVNDVHNQLRIKRDQASTAESSTSVNTASGTEGARARNARA